MKFQFVDILFFILIALPFLTNGQPLWLNNDIPQSGHYNYYRGVGQHTQAGTAKSLAIEDVKLQLTRRQGVTFQIERTSEIELLNVQDGKEAQTRTTFKVKGKSRENGQTVEAALTVVEVHQEYIHERSEYLCHVLVRVPKNGREKDRPLYSYVTRPAAWRSAIIPGWGQLYKSRYNPAVRKKGQILLFSELAFIGGAIAAQAMYSQNHGLAFDTQSTTQREIYLSNRDKWGTVRYTAIASAGTVYIYSLLDAAFNKEAKRYTFLPFAPEGGIGACLTFKINN